MTKLRLPKRQHRTQGGTTVVHRKSTSAVPTAVMPCPETVLIPMKQHIGAPCTPCVRSGDAVAVGDIIGKSDAVVSAPIHASISGTVVRVQPMKLGDSTICDAVLMKSDGLMRMSKSVRPPVIRNRREFIDAVRSSGLVGLGGAGFPTSVKLDYPDKYSVDTLVVNCAECEAYITSDNRTAVENTADVIDGITAVMKHLDIARAVIGVEDNKPDALDALKNAVVELDDELSNRICVLKLRTHYPQGDEIVLIKACTGRTLAKGHLPAEVGCIVMNISSAAFIGMYLKTGVPLVSRRITVDGSAVKEPKNVLVPIGTSISEVIKFCGGYSEPCRKLMYGGPMMGIALPNDAFPIVKQNNAVLALSQSDAVLPEPTACIRCGRCVAVCPMRLMPEAVEKAVRINSTELLKKHYVEHCIECGSCAYSCPAKRPLVQVMRIAKEMLREEKEKGLLDGK